MARPYELLIFDWDGTVLDSVSTIVSCTRQTLRDLGQAPLPDQAIRDLIGLGLRETVEALCPGCDEELYLQVLATYRRLWVDTYSRLPKAFAGVPETLRQLREAGYLMAVATAKSRSGLKRDMDRSDLEPIFHATRTVDEARSKPDPQMVLDILDEMGVFAADALVIGDTVHDLQMARNAGVDCVGVTSGAQAAGTLQELCPDGCLGGVVELPGWLSERAAGGKAE